MHILCLEHIHRYINNFICSWLSTPNFKNTSFFNEMLDIIRALFIESNPVPVKTAMNLMGLPSGPLRQPLCEMKEENLEILKKALKDSNLI